MRRDGTVSIVKIVCLSPRVENLKVKKVIKVSYLNNRESSVLRDFYAYEYFTYLCVLHIRIFDVYLMYHIPDERKGNTRKKKAKNK